MNKNKLFLLLSLFVILMTVFGNAFAQETAAPQISVSSVEPDVKIVVRTRNFPADTSYVVSMSGEDTPDEFTNVARFNSKTGGTLNVTIPIPEKFQGQHIINIRLSDGSGNVIAGAFENIPEEQTEEPVEEEPAEEPVEEEPTEEEPAEEPVEEEPTEEEPTEEEPIEEEPIEEEPAADESTISLVNQDSAVEEQTEETAEEPVSQEQTGKTDQEPAAEEQAEEMIDRPASEEQSQESAGEELTEEVVEEPEEEAVLAEPGTEAEAEAVIEINVPAATTEPLVCDFSVTPTVTIDSVVKNTSVTFTTHNYPKNSSFTVSMGVYVESWTPVPVCPKPSACGKPAPAPHFDPMDSASGKPGPKYEWRRNVSFNGTPVGTFETGDASSQTLTFTIPESLKGVSPIAIWISDNGPCGYYSYNYFYNLY